MADITAQRNLNPERRDRTHQRVVKRARHNSYPVKKPTDRRQPPQPTTHHRPANLLTSKNTMVNLS